MLKILLTRRKRVDSVGDMPRPVLRASGAATKTGDEVGDQLQGVVGHPAVSVGQSNERCCTSTDRAWGNTSQLVGTTRCHLAGREQQDIEDHAVEQPQGVDAEMPPAR